MRQQPTHTRKYILHNFLTYLLVHLEQGQFRSERIPLEALKNEANMRDFLAQILN